MKQLLLAAMMLQITPSYKQLFCLLALLLGSVGIAHAGAVLDGSMGTTGTLSGNFTVPSSSGKTVGNNLFHSFTSFSVNSGESASFTGPATIQNVISRVTGGSSSTINGLIDSKTSMPNANFFLLNPAGVIFGSGASLNVGGAFHASTADYLLFGSTGEKFYSDPKQTSVLSSAAPTAFGFLQPPTGSISTSSSTLSVGAGKQISLSGGGITVASSTISAPSGSIDLISTSSAGEFGFSTAAPTTNSFTSLGSVNISNASLIDTTSTAAGTVYIRGGIFTTDNSTIKANKTGAGAAGGIDIIATISTTLDNNSTLALQSEAGASGVGNNLTLNSPFIAFRNGSKITTTSFGAGNGGTTAITASGLVDFNGSNIFLQAQGAGNAASLTIQADNIRLSAGSSISSSTSGSGLGGNVTMTANKAVLFEGENSAGTVSRVFLQSKAGASGNAGTLSLTAADIAFRDGAGVSTITASTGAGGNATINASNSLELSGVDVGGNASRIYTATANTVAGGGMGGNLTVNSGSITMTNGAAIISEATGTGSAGSVTINATGAVTLDGTNAAGQASGISAASKPDSAVLTGITKTAGSAGNITITAPSLALSNGGFISGSSVASTGLTSSSAGAINLTVSGTTTIDGVNPFGENSDGFGSGIYSRSALGGGVAAGSAGSVTLNNGALLLTNGGVINSSTDNSASGGVVTINGGSINISGSGSAKFSGAASQNSFGTGATTSNSGLFASSDNTTTGGSGGNILMTKVATLDIGSGGTISSASKGDGAGGRIDLQLTNLTMRGGNITSASSSTAATAGNAGSIKIQASDAITLRSSALISTESINGGGGGMILNAINRLEMDGSQITTSVQGGLGNGGDINIDPRFVIMNRSNIIANAFGGNGGNINIVAGNFLQSTTSIVSASSQLGIAGNIKIDSPEVEVDAGLIHLPSSFLDASRWISSPCRVQSAGSQSSFVVTQQDGIPLQLDEWLPGPYGIASYRDVAYGTTTQRVAFNSLLPLCTQDLH